MVAYIISLQDCEDSKTGFSCTCALGFKRNVKGDGCKANGDPGTLLFPGQNGGIQRLVTTPSHFLQADMLDRVRLFTLYMRHRIIHIVYLASEICQSYEMTQTLI